jgi:hypothetical membrane protein
MNLRRLGLICGVLGPVLWIALIGLAGIERPGFSLMTDYISELGERASPAGPVVNYAAFIFTGALYVGFAAALGATFAGRWACGLAAALVAIEGIGRIGAGVYACDPGCDGNSPVQVLHRLFATVGFSAGAAAPLAWGLIAWKEPRLRGLAWCSMATGVVASVLLLLMSSGDSALPGLLEHLASGLLSLWLLALAARLLVTSRPQAKVRPPPSAARVG